MMSAVRAIRAATVIALSTLASAIVLAGPAAATVASDVGCGTGTRSAEQELAATAASIAATIAGPIRLRVTDPPPVTSCR